MIRPTWSWDDRSLNHPKYLCLNDYICRIIDSIKRTVNLNVQIHKTNNL